MKVIVICCGRPQMFGLFYVFQKFISFFYIIIRCTITTGATWVTKLVGGGQNRPWALGTLIYEGDKSERNKKYLRGVCTP
jgi:hypothetical protein